MKEGKTLSVKLLTTLCALLFFRSAGVAQSSHQINVSFVLSGHIFVGVGYTYGLDANWQAGMTVMLAPEKGLPMAFNVGGGYLGKGEHWRARWWGEFMVIASPPDPKERKYLPLINFVPGLVYYNGDQTTYSAEAWLSFLPIQKKFAPTGLEFQVGRRF